MHVPMRRRAFMSQEEAHSFAGANASCGADFQFCRWLRFWRTYHRRIIAPFLQINKRNAVSKENHAVVSCHFNLGQLRVC